MINRKFSVCPEIGQTGYGYHYVAIDVNRYLAGA
jgi:hypothetical protein